MKIQRKRNRTRMNTDRIYAVFGRSVFIRETSVFIRVS